jgi:hypothetical protein
LSLIFIVRVVILENKYNFHILLVILILLNPLIWFTLIFGVLHDEDITSIHTMNGPITRSRARQLNLQVRSTLVNCVSELMLGAMDVLMIRNFGEDQQGLGKGLGVEDEQQGRHNKKEIKSDSAATPSRVPETVCTKMDAQDASGLRLRQT